MKRTLVVLAGLVLLSACESERTVKGVKEKCYGLNGEPQPGVKYEYSVGNIIFAIVFSELIAPPVIVVLSELKCPVTP